MKTVAVEYKGYILHFVFAEEVLLFLSTFDVSVDDITSDKYRWFEVDLFENIDDDGVPDTSLGKDFSVVFTEYTDNLVNTLSLRSATVSYDKNKVVYKSTLVYPTEFALQYVVVRK